MTGWMASVWIGSSSRNVPSSTSLSLDVEEAVATALIVL